MPPPNKRQKRARRAALLRHYFKSEAKNTESTDKFLNHQSAQKQQCYQNVSEILNIGFVPQSVEKCSFTNDSINTKGIEKPNESTFKNMPTCPNVYDRRKVDLRQCKQIEDTRIDQDFQKQCSSTSDIDGRLNDIMERINENCANCASHFEHENERNVKFKTSQRNQIAKSNEIEIIDAIFYIYGLTVADWSKTLNADHQSDFTSASEIVFSNGITFCDECTSALENVYESHKKLKELAHNDSLFSKTLNSKTIREIENKIECDEENYASSLNNSDLSDGELEFKEEVDSEEINTPMIDFKDSNQEINYELDDALMEDSSDELPTLHHPFNILCCDESFVSKEEFANHQLKSHSTDMEKPILVKCNICEIKIPKDNVDRHKYTYYKQVWKKYFNCKICNSQFESASAMTEHLQTHDPKYATLICNICEIPTQSNLQLIAHRKKNHSDSEILRVCIVCEKIYSSWSNLRYHMKRMHEQIPDEYKYNCIHCDTLFTSEFDLSLHREKSINCRHTTTKRRSVCEKCGKSILEGYMHRHMQQHEDIECPNKELFRCSQCGKMLKHSDSLRKHVLREHPEKEKLFFCEKCGKTTKNMTNMRIHMKVHEKE